MCSCTLLAQLLNEEGNFPFLKTLNTGIVCWHSGIHEASLGKHFLRAGMDVSGSGPGQLWKVNEEKRDSSMKEGNKPEGLSR